VSSGSPEELIQDSLTESKTAENPEQALTQPVSDENSDKTGLIAPPHIAGS
jgi:hypothetical protein